MIRVNHQVLKDKEYIFVDFFDTIMFRSVHSQQMLPLWARALSAKLGIAQERLIRARKSAIKRENRNECAIPYKILCSHIYSQLQNIIPDVTQDEFYRLSLEIETYIEFGVQYINKEMLNFLKKQKQQGKKIVLVTDFYLPGKTYQVFMQKCNLCDLVDCVYCSSDIGKTKYDDGELYGVVLESLNISPAQVFMIGDRTQPDVENANKFGIAAIRYFPIVHKLWTNFCKFFIRDCSVIAHRTIKKEAQKNCPFGAYIFPLAYTIKKLNTRLYEESQNANFLSRGGYFLKILFDTYEDLVIPNAQKIKSFYVHNARKVNEKAKNNEKDRNLLRKYLQKFMKDDTFCFVDEGWNGHGQMIFTQNLDLKTKGFYLGLFQNPPIQNCQREGLLFEKSAKQESPLYGVFRTNCTLYEQLLTAPHGSVEAYRENDTGKIEAVCKYNEVEQQLYTNYTAAIQKQLLDYAKSLFVCGCDFNLYDCGKIVLKELLFANYSKRQILLQYDKSYYNNIDDSEEKNFGTISSIKINLLDLIVNPENYLRYFCKLRQIFHSKAAYALYLPIGVILYCYLKISILVKWLIKGASF